jgi:succinoglycan biosynthesis protein ExoA
MSDSSATLDDPVHSRIDTCPPSVTVVVPVRNEEAHISQTLGQLIDQDVHGINVEILVVDGESTDQTVAIVEQYVQRHPHIRLLTNPQRLSSAARNLAIKNSHSDYFIVIDGHCEIPNRRYFFDLIKAFEETGADCLGRPQPLEVSNASPLQRAIAIARSSRLGHHPESFIYSETAQPVPAKSVAVAYRRDVFDKVGLFDETFDAHEDGEFNFRCDQAGLKCYLDPKLTVKYFPRETLAGLFKQMVRYGRGRVRFAHKHPGNWGLGSLVPAAFVLFVVVGGLAAIVFPISRPLYATALGFYLIVLEISAFTFAWKERTPSMLLGIPLILATVHVGAGIGVISELFRIRKRTSEVVRQSSCPFST